MLCPLSTQAFSLKPDSPMLTTYEGLHITLIPNGTAVMMPGSFDIRSKSGKHIRTYQNKLQLLTPIEHTLPCAERVVPILSPITVG